MAIYTELRSRNCPEIRSRSTRKQFYVVETQLVNQFTESITLPLTRWYQEVLGNSEEGALGVDRQKLALSLSLMIKLSYSSSLLVRYPMIWEKKIRGGYGNREVGFGLKGKIDKYGFGWIEKSMVDWEANNFADGVADRFPFPIRSVENHYRAKRKERAQMMDILNEVDQVAGRIRLLETRGGSDERKRSFLISWLALRIIRQYHIDVWTGLYRSSYEFVGKTKELERQRTEAMESIEDMDSSSDEYNEAVEPVNPIKRRRIDIGKSKSICKSFDEPPKLTYQSVIDELQEKPHSCGRGKQYVDRSDMFGLLFMKHLEADNELKQGWKRQPYLHGISSTKAKLREKDFKQLSDELWSLFERYCLCIPSASKDRWLAHSPKTKMKPGWIGFGENGERIERPEYFFSKSKSSWGVETDISKEHGWNIDAESATSPEGLRDGVR
jgi:hypothetical protein